GSFAAPAGRERPLELCHRLRDVAPARLLRRRGVGPAPERRVGPLPGRDQDQGEHPPGSKHIGISSARYLAQSTPGRPWKTFAYLLSNHGTIHSLLAALVCQRRTHPFVLALPDRGVGDGLILGGQLAYGVAEHVHQYGLADAA